MQKACRYALQVYAECVITFVVAEAPVRLAVEAPLLLQYGGCVDLWHECVEEIGLAKVDPRDTCQGDSGARPIWGRVGVERDEVSRAGRRVDDLYGRTGRPGLCADLNEGVSQVLDDRGVEG